MGIIDALLNDALAMYLVVRIFDRINHIRMALHPYELN